MALLDKIYLYRMIHIRNIPHILKHGITHKDSANANPDYLAIGDGSLIEFRETKKVLITNGNPPEFAIDEIVLGNFIPFYFGYRTPMLFVIQKGGNFVPQPTPPDDIIYIVSSVGKIMEHNLTFYFTNGHATDGYTEFYDASSIENVEKIVDFTATRAKYWKQENDLDLKRRKEAEFLVKEDLPVSCILGFICYNQDAREKLLEFGINDKQIVVNSKYYF